MSLQRKSKWVKHTKPIKEQGMHEEIRISWAELFGQSVPKKPKKHHEPALTVREQVKKRDHNRCKVCGREATSLHHIIFRSQGGKNDVQNLICLCSEHHTGAEGPHQSIEWRRYWEEWQKENYPEYLNEVRENKCIHQA